MPTHYLYGTILTGEAVAANNRGDNIGNTTTLQKVFVGDELHTSVSAEAIRFAFRYRFQLEALKVNRSYEVSKDQLEYKDGAYLNWTPNDPDPFVDDDILGFMSAKAAKSEQEAEEGDEDPGEPDVKQVQNVGKKTTATAKGKSKEKKGATKRTSPLAVGRAVSLRPYRGEISFNCVSGTKEKGALSLYSAEMHTTEYQYSFGLNLGDVVAKANIRHLIDAIVDPPHVAGNHSRFSYDFSPASIIFRLTNCHSSKIQNCFAHDEATRGWTVDKLMRRVESGDVPASELIVAGFMAGTEFGESLKKQGATVLDGVLQAAQEVKMRIAKLGDPFTIVSGKGAAS